MKLECLQENLAEGLTVVGRVVPTKSTLPVLSNVLLSTRDGELQLTANNLELSVAHRVPAAIADDGPVFVTLTSAEVVTLLASVAVESLGSVGEWTVAEFVWVPAGVEAGTV